ncbi:MAG: IclR family transcriptional regulator [Parvibaculaceae bacterium]
MTTASRGIQSIEVGGRVLSALVRTASPMMLKDLALAADLTPAQVHAYLTSYRRAGLVEQDDRTGHYRIGPLAFRLGTSRIRSVPILEETSRTVTRLSSELGLMAIMVCWGPHGPTAVQVQDSPVPMNLNIKQGTLFSVTGTASGHVFAAFSDEPSLATRIAAELDEGAGESAGMPLPVSFTALVERVRSQGYADIAGLPIPGMHAVSAPVRDASGDVVAAVTLVGSGESLNRRLGTAVVQALLAATAALSGGTRPA